MGFYPSPFKRALIVSFDYGGNDGFFNVYDGRRGGGPSNPGRDEIQLIERSGLRLGELYTRASQVEWRNISITKCTNTCQFLLTPANIYQYLTTPDNT